MKRLAIITVSTLAAIALIGVAILQIFPGTALSGLQRGGAVLAGFDRKTVIVDGYEAHYYEAGPETAPVVVLMHGLIDDKNSFVPSAAGLAETHRVILPDLLGHGENAQTEGRDYSIRGQVAFIIGLLDALDVQEVTIGGNSMGGHVAAAFALSDQERVRRLLLLNATGILLDAPPTYSEYPDRIDLAYMTDLYAHVFITPPSIPRPIMRHLARDLNAKAPFYNVLVDQVIGGEDFRLDERITALSVPTLVIWGTEDNLVPIQYAEAYHAKLPVSELTILEAGHAPQMEVPQEVAAEMQAFITAP